LFAIILNHPPNEVVKEIAKLYKNDKKVTLKVDLRACFDDLDLSSDDEEALNNSILLLSPAKSTSEEVANDQQTMEENSNALLHNAKMNPEVEQRDNDKGVVPVSGAVAATSTLSTTLVPRSALTPTTSIHNKPATRSSTRKTISSASTAELLINNDSRSVSRRPRKPGAIAGSSKNSARISSKRRISAVDVIQNQSDASTKRAKVSDKSTARRDKKLRNEKDKIRRKEAKEMKLNTRGITKDDFQ
jgi:uncharacterized protein with WD repeat